MGWKKREYKVKSESQLNKVNEKLKVSLEKIVFIDDFPMEVVPQLFKLQKFCDKALEIDVTPFNNGKKIDYKKDDNEKRTKRVMRKVENILGVEPNTPAEKNPDGDNLKPRSALSKLKFIWINQHRKKIYFWN